MSQHFGILYDSTFNAMYDPYDVRYGHARAPRQPKPFTPLNQCGAQTVMSYIPYVALAAAVVALSVVALRKRK